MGQDFIWWQESKNPKEFSFDMVKPRCRHLSIRKKSQIIRRGEMSYIQGILRSCLWLAQRIVYIERKNMDAKGSWNHF